MGTKIIGCQPITSKFDIIVCKLRSWNRVAWHASIEFLQPAAGQMFTNKLQVTRSCMSLFGFPRAGNYIPVELKAKSSQDADKN